MDLHGLRAPDVGDRGRRDAWDAVATAYVVLGAAYLPTFHPGISAKQLQRQLGIGCHETAWAMLHKLRGAMVAPERERLKGEVEIDEFFLGGHEDHLKGGRQHGKKALVGAAIEVRGQGSGRLRLGVLENSQATTLEAFTKVTTAPGSIVHTDGLFSYNGLSGLGYEHRPRKVASVAAGEKLLPRAHRAISNLKAWMHGTHRSVAAEHLPVYLDEFVFSPQPTRFSDGRLSDAPGARAGARAEHLPRHH